MSKLSKYIIGILDENAEEIEYIISTICYHSAEKEIGLEPGKDFDFKIYDANSYESGIKEEVLKSILTDVRDGELDSLIIDYKLMIQDRVEKGSEIFNELKKEVPRFPAVVLTQVVSESKMDDLVDSDKIYDKEKFFSTRTPDKENQLPGYTSKENVLNIFRNMRIYVDKREELEKKLASSQAFFEKEDTDSNYANLVNIEKELSKYSPMMTPTEAVKFEPKQLSDTVNILKSVREMLEELN